MNELSRVSTDEAALAWAASDFGHHVHRRPVAVLRPRTTACVAAAVRLGRRSGIPVVARGAGHSVDGQAQAPDGIVIDMGTLGAVDPVGADRVGVGAGAPWSRVLAATLPRGLAPPVLPDHLELTVGGTLSVGGFGGASHRHGSLADNAYDLEVVTPAGDIVVCSPSRDADLFDAVRGTQGEHGIITRATVALAVAPRTVRRCHLVYGEAGTLLAEQRLLVADGRFDHVLGQVRHVAGVGWQYLLEAAAFGPPGPPDDRALLDGLAFDPAGLSTETLGYDAFVGRYAAVAAALRASGTWSHPHPRCTVLLPGRHAAAFVGEILDELRPDDLGLDGSILVYPIPTGRLRAPNVPKAADATTVVLSVLRTVPPGDVRALARMRRANEALREAAGRVGGASYAGRTAYHDARDGGVRVPPAPAAERRTASMAHDGRPTGLRAMADLATPMAIRVAATIRVADHIASGRRTAPEIARASGVHAGALDRVLRHLVTAGLFTRDDAGRYATTELGEQLRDDHPAGRRRWLDVNGGVGRGDLSFVELVHTVRTGGPAYPIRYGETFWADLDADPALSASFDALMGQHVQRDIAGIARAYDWAALGRVVDVGGGSGALLNLLLTAHPGLTGTVLDLPGPVSRAQKRFADSGLADRATAVAGSFFDPLPPGAGGYVLSAIIHDWDDEPAVAVLRRCAEAAGRRGVVLVVEAIGADGESTDTAMDLRMLAYTGGRERGLGQLCDLAGRAGLSLRAKHPVLAGSYMSIVEFTAT